MSASPSTSTLLTTGPMARTGIHDLPPEILAGAFEMIIYTSNSDISLILPLTLVCRAWHAVITHTPRLWGILSLNKSTQPKALAKRIAHAKAAPLSITADSRVRLRDGAMGKQIKALAALIGNWEELDVGLEFLVAACDLDRNRDREKERELGSREPIGCEPLLGWVDMCRSLRSLTLGRGQRDHEMPGAFFTHNGGVNTHSDVKLESFTSVSLPKSWIFGFLGPSIKHLRLLGGDKGVGPWSWSNTNVQSQIISAADLLTILTRVPNATLIELEKTDNVVWYYQHLIPPAPTPASSQHKTTAVHLPSLRELRIHGLFRTPFFLSAIRAPALQTLSVTRVERTWRDDPNQPLAPVFAQWSQPGYVMENLHTLELINCLKNDDDIPYLIRWLSRTKSLVRLFITQELDCARGLGDPDGVDDDGGEGEGEETYLFKALASPRIVESLDPQGQLTTTTSWLCPKLMILRLDLPDTPIRSLISIARARGGILPYPNPSSISTPTPTSPPARLRGLETRLCAAAEQPDIDLLKSLVDNPLCICHNCALHLPLDQLAVFDVEFELE